jgi:hypothetical protein
MSAVCREVKRPIGVESVAMYAWNSLRSEYECFRVRWRLWAVVFAILSCGPGAWVVRGQSDSTEDLVTTMRGRVLNSVTKEPLARALVSLQGDRAAAMTDDHGQFELHVREKKPVGMVSQGVPPTSIVSLLARKPGFLTRNQHVSITYQTNSTQGDAPEVSIPLNPEALIVGHVEIPGSQGEVRIYCQLFQRTMQNGREIWMPRMGSSTWANGECRFSDLREGTYKLTTHKALDFDNESEIPGTRRFGYPPIYYPNTTDFSAATPIVVKTGETVQVNLTVERREYFPVRIPVQNLPPGEIANVDVLPAGHDGPGWSLSFSPGDQVIDGALPNGNYTVEAYTISDNAMSGIANISVKGGAVEGPAIHLVPDASVNVQIREEFQDSSTSNFLPGKTTGTGIVGGKRLGNVRVTLEPAQEIGVHSAYEAFPAEGSGGRILLAGSVRPGRYQVEVNARNGYPATVESGGLDLKGQPLTVGLGGVQNIEVTLRDDGAEIDGTIEEDSEAANPAQNASGTAPVVYYGYLLKMSGSDSAGLAAYLAAQGAFKAQQLAPGDYLVLACDCTLSQFPTNDAEKLKQLEDNGKVVHVEPGEKVSVKVKLMKDE